VVLGYSYGAAFDQEHALRRDVSMDNQTLLKKLELRRYRLVVSDEHVIHYYARQDHAPELETILQLSDNPQYLAFSKQLGQRGQHLAEQFSQVIRAMRDDGTLARIKAKYF